jgi:type II secretory pathway component PulJ
MPILPLIDLLLLMGTGSLLIGFLLKTIAITTRFRPHILGFTSIDFVLIAGVCMGLALVLAARTWVQLNEPKALAQRRDRLAERLRREQAALEKAAFALAEEVGEEEGLDAVPGERQRRRARPEAADGRH